MPPEGLAADEQVVLIESRAPRRSSVRFDSEGGAAAAFEHLLELGHRRIGHLAADFDAPTFHLREDARRRVLSGAGLDPDALPRAVTQITIDDARDAAGPLLDEQPTAVFCDDDIVAAGLYLAARERGLRIPRDLSVVGFDDMDFARVLDPAADHRGARRRAAGRHRLRAARGAHGRRAPAAPDRAPGRARGARLDRAAAMSDAARAAFEAHAEDYEAERRRLLPCFDAFYAAAVEAVGLSGRPPGRVLDLGAGTGLLAGFVARRLPGGAAHPARRRRRDARAGPRAPRRRRVLRRRRPRRPAARGPVGRDRLGLGHPPPRRPRQARPLRPRARGPGPGRRVRQRRAGRRGESVARRRLRRSATSAPPGPWAPRRPSGRRPCSA